MTPEGKVKEKVKGLLKANGIWYTMPIGQTYCRQGSPDFLCCVRGMFVGIETKAGYGKPTAMQKEQMNCINESGGFTFCVNEKNFDILKEWIETACKAFRPAEGKHFGIEIC